MWVESTMTEMWLHAGTVLPENLAPFAAGFYFIGDFCRKTNVSTAFSERFSAEMPPKCRQPEWRVPSGLSAFKNLLATVEG